jgi:multiple sugar transport system substrate-binding protein
MTSSIKEACMKKLCILVAALSLLCLFVVVPMFAQQEGTAGTSLAGQTISVLHLTGKHWDVIFNSQVPNFEKQTGIKAMVDYLDEKAEMPKVRVVLGAKSDEYDVIFFRGNFMPELIRTGGVEPLDSYIAKAKAADKAFNYDDLIPAIAEAFNYEGKQWGLPLMGGGTVLFYNKEHFAAAGLSRPPKNLDELEEYAKKLTTKDHAGFALRGRREAGTNVYPWIFIWKIQGAKRFDNIRGNWFDENWQPQLATPAAITAVERWANLLRNYGPKGVASYGWQECLADLQQAAVSMWLDDPVFVSSVEDPALSKVAGKTGYTVVEGPGKLFGAVAPWGFIMNAYSKKKEAAWEFIKWATGHDTQLGMVSQGYGLPTRKSVLESDVMKGKMPAEYLAALTKAMSVADPAYKPLIPQQAEINDLTSIALSKVLTGQASATKAMNELNEKVLAIMKRDGYIK